MIWGFFVAHVRVGLTDDKLMHGLKSAKTTKPPEDHSNVHAGAAAAQPDLSASSQ